MIVAAGPAAPRWARLGVKAGLALALLLAGYLAVIFVQVYRASRVDDARPSQAVVVLGAAQYDGRPSAALQARLDHAYELFTEGLASIVVVTGGSRPGDRFTEAATGYRYLRGRGVPESALLREEAGANTWEQLAGSARLLRERGASEVLLVSDGFHAYRLGAVAAELGLDAAVSPSGSRLSTGAELRALARETAAVAVGEVIGFRRLEALGEAAGRAR